MAATAVTSVVLNKQTVFGDERVSWVTITMSASYQAGGDSFTAAQCGLDVIDYLTFIGVLEAAATTTAYVPGFHTTSNGASALIQAFGGAASGVALAESGTSDLHTFSVQALVYGV